MISNHSLARRAVVTLALACSVALAGSATAVTINGRVVNGTTGDQNVEVAVQVIDPSAGMAPVQQTQSVGGKFTVTGLEADAPIYLLRVDHQGVLYTATVRPEGRNTVETTVSIYDTTSSWEGIHVTVPHIAAASHEGHLQIETMYEIHNNVDPPRTISGESAQFLVYIPEDKLEIIRSFVSYHDVPLDRLPVPTDEAGVHRVDYPIRPGQTRVGVSYSVPYTNDAYSLAYKSFTDIENMTIYAVNPGMKLTSSTLALGPGEAVHDMTAYEVAGLSKGSEFQLTITGGEAVATGAAGGTQGAGAGQPSVVVLPSGAESVSTMVMVIVLLALLAFMGIATHGAVDPLKDEKQVQGYYTTLLKRMAKLDDLHQADMIADDVYRTKRDELKTQLAALRYRLHKQKPAGGRKNAKDVPQSRKVSGNERMSP